MIYGHGGDIYTHKPDLDFSVNVNPLGPPEGVVRAAKHGAERMEAYPDSRCRMLREKLSLRQDISGEAVAKTGHRRGSLYIRKRGGGSDLPAGAGGEAGAGADSGSCIFRI